MDQPFIGMIALFGFNFAPRGWMFCDGRLLSITQYSALFALISTTYGGDGIHTFALPDLRGRAPLGFGEGPGLSMYQMGEAAGQESVTLLQTQMPQHNHLLIASAQPATSNTPEGHLLAVSTGALDSGSEGVTVNTYGTAASTTLNPMAVSTSGSNQPHTNMQPYLTMNYCIAIAGIYPTQG